MSGSQNQEFQHSNTTGNRAQAFFSFFSFLCFLTPSFCRFSKARLILVATLKAPFSLSRLYFLSSFLIRQLGLAADARNASAQAPVLFEWLHTMLHASGRKLPKQCARCPALAESSTEPNGNGTVGLLLEQ